jgi:hypothetical protein
VDRSLPITPTFVLPYKRYATPLFLHLGELYLAENHLSLRKATTPNGMAVCYTEREVDNRCLSHTTLWRWLTFLGTMTVTLQTGIDLYLRQFPNSSMHRFEAAVAPHKYRSEARSQILRQARHLLYLNNCWQKVFAGEKFFPRFATMARAP